MQKEECERDNRTLNFSANAIEHSVAQNLIETSIHFKKSIWKKKISISFPL